jgi:hypothetical protein
MINFIKNDKVNMIITRDTAWTSDGQIADTRFRQVSAIQFKLKFKETRNVI